MKKKLQSNKSHIQYLREILTEPIIVDGLLQILTQMLLKLTTKVFSMNSSASGSMNQAQDMQKVNI